MLELLPDPTLVIDAAFCLVWGNQACTRSTGHTLADWKGRSVLELLHPDDYEVAMVRLTTLEGKPVGVRVRTAEGQWRHWELLAELITDGDYAGGLVIGARDTTHRHALEVAGNDIGLLRALVNHSSAMLAVIDPDGMVRSINNAFTRELGYNSSTVAGTPYDTWIVPRDRERVAAAVLGTPASGSIALDATMVHADGSEVLVEFSIIDLSEDPSVCGLIVSGQVSYSLMAARQQAKFLAAHDLSTGLLNRVGMFEAGAALERHAARTGDPIGVIMLDLDRLAQINELYGTLAGDAVIHTVAARLGSTVRPEDLVVRHDGDEFVIAALGPLDNLLAMRDRLIQTIVEPIMVGDVELRVTASFAVASSATPGTTLAELVDLASADLEHAHRFVNADGQSGSTALAERRLLVDQLQLALERDELQLWFQPIVDVDARVCAYEALLRWNHPARGVLVPAVFLPLVAAAGLHDRVDRIVLRQAVDFVARIRERSDDANVIVHVNVTPAQVSTPGFAGEFEALCRNAGVPAHQLCAEITETDVLRISAVAIENLAEMRRFGVHIAIDDFGTGFSSLAHLLELPVDMLKIDRRFVSGMGIDSMATSLTSAIIGITNSVGMECVAEGVETIEQRDQLVALGCRQLQGWLYEPALRPERALELLGTQLPIAVPTS